MVIDYVWHFQAPPREPTHFAPDYWMPAPALVMAGAERIFGLGPARKPHGAGSLVAGRSGIWSTRCKARSKSSMAMALSRSSLPLSSAS